MRHALILAASLALLASQASAAELSDATKAKLNGQWTLDAADPASAAYLNAPQPVFAFNFAYEGGLVRRGEGVDFQWLPIRAAEENGSVVRIVPGGPDILDPVVMSLAGEDRAVLAFPGPDGTVELSFTRHSVPADWSPLLPFQQARMLTRSGSSYGGYAVLKAEESDAAVACADPARAHVSFDLFTPGTETAVKTETSGQGGEIWAVRLTAADYAQMIDTLTLSTIDASTSSQGEEGQLMMTGLAGGGSELSISIGDERLVRCGVPFGEEE